MLRTVRRRLDASTRPGRVVVASAAFPLVVTLAVASCSPTAQLGQGDASAGAGSVASQAAQSRATGSAGSDAALKRRLAAAYPDAFRFEGNHVVFPSGERVVWDDGRQKSPEELLTSADVEDMFAYPYPAGAPASAPPRHHDPGRVRSEPFFRALYGGSRAAVSAEVRQVPWMPALNGGTVAVTSRLGVADKVADVSAALEQLPPRFHPYLVEPAGGFVWRTIAGTGRLSVHAFGAALDINAAQGDYWRWDGAPAGGPITYRNRVPIEIVEVFERHCFIWGGRWYHYDTLHFEYRPELLPGCHRARG